MQFPPIFFRVRAATIDARERTGDERIGVVVKQGKARVVLTWHDGADDHVQPVSDYMPIADVVAYLNAMR